MDSLPSPLVLTKLRLPVLRRRLIPRQRPLERLAAHPEARLALVCAPAGYGKTTLLREWAEAQRQQGVRVAWYSVDAGDDTPTLFGSYLLASLAQASREATLERDMGQLGQPPAQAGRLQSTPAAELDRLAKRLRLSPEPSLEGLLPAAINALATDGREYLLVLDDYHLLRSLAIHRAVTFLLEHLPENLRLAIGSRSTPPLPLARLRACGQLLEIRAADLRFTAEETRRFLAEVMQLELSPQVVSALGERTEGWAAGLQLAALSLAGRSDAEAFLASFTGGQRYLAEYLFEEVVTRQPEEVQRFLLYTSPLERLCASLCEAVSASQKPKIENREPSRLSSSASILDNLDRTNLFLVPLDEAGEWYRYHHLFREFLSAQLLKSQPETVPELHRAASQWLAAHDFLREAVQHALHTGDWEYAAGLVEQHSFNMIIHSEIAMLHAWCSAFPEEVMRRHPYLCIHQCWAWVFSFRRENRAKAETRLKQAEEAIARMPDTPEKGELSDAVAVVRAFLVMTPDPAADPQAQLTAAREMLAACPEEDASQFSALLAMGYAYLALQEAEAAGEVLEKAHRIALHENLYYGVVETTFHLARLACAQGQLDRSAGLCWQAQADLAAVLAQPEQELPAIGCLDLALGCALLEQGRLEEAETALLHGLSLIRWGMPPYYLMTGWVALFQLRLLQGRPAEALDCLARLEAAWPDVSFLADGLRVTLALRTAPDDSPARTKAAAWSQSFSAAVELAPSPSAVIGISASGSGAQARRMETRRPFLPGLGPFGAAEAYYLASLAWAAACLAMGEAPEALDYLEKQREIAERNGLAGRLKELTGLLGQGRRGAPGPAVIGESDEPLSERELQVLRLMAQGATNQDIAEELVITVGTVKSHINHILTKLDAHNRTEAVAKARGMGLIDG